LNFRHFAGSSASCSCRNPLEDHFVPGVAVDHVLVAAGSGFPLPADHVELHQPPHGSGDRGGADLQHLGEFGRGEPPGVGGLKRGEDTGRHTLHAGLHQARGEMFDEPSDGLGVPLCHAINSSGGEALLYTIH
jgi:hypothetical protein